MFREDQLPVQFAPLAAKVHYVHKKSSNEYSSSCPDCGGSPHADGSMPDRFIMLINSTATGKAFAFCRRCGLKWWEDKEKGNDLTPEQKRAWIMEQEKRAADALREAESQYKRTLSLLSSEKHWLRYHENLTAETRKLWRYRGIPDSWQDRWCLGYCNSFSAWVGDTEYLTPSLTIPIQEKDQVLNIRHRLINPPYPHDKYRPERKGLGTPPFLANADLAYDAERFLVVEGEIKAGVTYIAMDDKNLQVIGVTGTNSWENVVSKIAKKETWVCFDPGAEKHARDFAKAVNGKVFSLPVKIDDAIIAGSLEKKSILGMMRSARAIRS